MRVVAFGYSRHLSSITQGNRLTYVSEAFPIHIGNCRAACCNIVMSTPLLITFLKKIDETEPQMANWSQITFFFNINLVQITYHVWLIKAIP